jgi:hypothetical protein
MGGDELKGAEQVLSVIGSLDEESEEVSCLYLLVWGLSYAH